MKKLLSLSLACLVISTYAAAIWTYQKCNNYYDNKDYEQAALCFEANIKYNNLYLEEYNASILWAWASYALLADEFANKKGLVNNREELQKALTYYQKANEYSTTTEQKDIISGGIKSIEWQIAEFEARKTAPSNDKLSYLQYYLKSLNVVEAWKKIKNNNEVIVAVIDDGVFFNHPDLLWKIWIDPSAEYWASKIIDFVGDNIGINLPAWKHGTRIAGIIAAITDNEIGIAWIAKNVKIMPLRVFNFDNKASDDNVIKAINYAVENGADIINLSLGASQFANYSKKYDTVIKNAYEKGVVVVIAAGNGDVLTKSQIGLDLKINPISPVCNNWWSTLYSIWVAAHDENGFRTFWTNYNSCISYFAYGSWILSTSIPAYEDTGSYYWVGDGTSFSAPIVSGIIALWYNQFWWVPPAIVKESLDESLIKNKAWNLMIDASKYIDALSRKSWAILQQQKNRTTNINTDSALPISTSSDAYILSSQGIIKEQNTIKAYNLNNNVLRQEVVWMAIKLGGFKLPDDYICQKIFSDVFQNKPNDWACRSIEVGVEAGIISSANKLFRPESTITRAEALWILLKAAWVSVESSDENSEYFKDVSVQWQVNLVNTALNNWIIDPAKYFYPNKNATRAEIFSFARKLLELSK